MEKGQAIACGAATFSASCWALFCMLVNVMEPDAAVLASFLLSLCLSAFTTFAYRSVRSSLKAVLASDGAIALLGTSFFWVDLPCIVGLALMGVALMIPLLVRERKPSYEKLVRLADLWTNYGGIMTVSFASERLGVSVEEAEELLRWYCKQGLAFRLVRDHTTIYYMPSVIREMPRLEALVLEAFLEKPTGLTEHELSSLTGLRAEVLKPALGGLVRRGLLAKHSDEYRLVVVSGLPEQRGRKRRRERRRRS